MKSGAILLKDGLAGDILIDLAGAEIFATTQRSYLRQSLMTFEEDGAAILLDPSYWWHDAGKEPEILRLERQGQQIIFEGKLRLEQTHGDSTTHIGQCDLKAWINAVQLLPE